MRLQSDYYKKILYQTVIITIHSVAVIPTTKSGLCKDQIVLVFMILMHKGPEVYNVTAWKLKFRGRFWTFYI